MAKLVLLDSPKPPKEKKRKLSGMPKTSENKKQKKDKNKKGTAISHLDVENVALTQNTSELKKQKKNKNKKGTAISGFNVENVDSTQNTSEHKKQKKNKNKKVTTIGTSDEENDNLTQNITEGESNLSKKGRKRKLADSEAPKILTSVKKLKTKSTKDSSNDSTVSQEAESDSSETNVPKLTVEEAMEKYPVLKDEELVKKYLAVPMTNGQKGCLRQRLRDSIRRASSPNDPEMINTKLAAILAHDPLTESDLRKIRILHNMLRTALRLNRSTRESLGKAPRSRNRHVQKKRKKAAEAETAEPGQE